MLFFLFKTKTKQIFSRSNLGAMILRIFYVFVSAFYAILTITLFKNSSFLTTDKIPDMILNINITATILIIIRNLIPSYKSYTSPFTAYYPITTFRRNFHEIFSATYSPLFIYLLIYFGTLTASTSYSILNFFISIIMMLIAFLLELMFKKLLEQKQKKQLILVLTFITLSVSYFFMINHFTGFELFLFLILSYLLFFGLSLAIDFNYTEGKLLEDKSSKKGHNNYYIKLFFRNKKLRLSFFVALIFKILILVVSIKTYLTKGTYIFDSYHYQFLFLFPLIFYTYIFNNYFGYSRECWILSKMTGNHKILIISFITPLILTICIDFSFSILSAYLLEIQLYSFAINYLFLFVILTLNGFIASIIRPIKITKLFSFDSLKNNSSFLFAIISALFVSSSFIPINILLLVILYLAIITSQAFIIKFVFMKHKQRIDYSFYHKVFQ